MSSGRPAALPPYQDMRRRPGLRRRLRTLMDDDIEEKRLVAAQGRAIDAWLHQYAVPRVHGPVGLDTFRPARFFHGKRLFDRIRVANAATRAHLDEHLRTLRADTDDVRRAVTAGIVILTLGGLVGGSVTTRLTSRRVRRPLAALRDVLTDLIAGEHDARAEPDGPREVVTIARSVNALADE